MFGLQALVSPVPVADFVRSYHGTQALMIDGATDKFAELCSWSDISHLLNHGALQYPNAKFVLDKEALGPEALQHADHWLRQGATLIINSIQRLDPVIEHFAAALSRDMNTSVNINCYTSWPSKQGFDIHFDRHDVFVLQVEGTKTWRVFQPTRTFPLELNKQQGKGDPPDGEPYLDRIMAPGDVMYIPRGHWHYAIADSPSVHLTVGPASRSGIDFLHWFVNQLMEKEAFLRRDFPIVDSALLGGSLDDAPFHDHVRRFREILHDTLDDDALVAHFVQYCMTTNPVRRYCPLPDYVTVVAEWDRDTRFRVNPNQKALLRHDPVQKHAVVLLRGHILNLEEVPDSLVRYLLDSEGSLSGRELKEACPELSWSKLRGFLLRLFEVGVIVQTEE